MKNLGQNKQFQTYDSIIREQLNFEIDEKVEKILFGREKSTTSLTKLLWER